MAINTQHTKEKHNRKCLPTECCNLVSCITAGNLGARPAAESKRDGESEQLDRKAEPNCRYKSSIKTLRSESESSLLTFYKL